MMKLIAFLSVALVLLPTVVADPVIMNLTMKCDFPEIRHWCAEVLVWEVDTSDNDDALGYTWQCTSSKTMDVQLTFMPDGDGNNFYEINHKVFTNCSPQYLKKYEQRCRCYENKFTEVSVEGRSDISREYNFYTDQGRNMTDRECRLPSVFYRTGTHMLGNNFVDSPCNVAFMIKMFSFP